MNDNSLRRQKKMDAIKQAAALIAAQLEIKDGDKQNDEKITPAKSVPVEVQPESKLEKPLGGDEKQEKKCVNDASKKEKEPSSSPSVPSPPDDDKTIDLNGGKETPKKGTETAPKTLGDAKKQFKEKTRGMPFDFFRSFFHFQSVFLLHLVFFFHSFSFSLSSSSSSPSSFSSSSSSAFFYSVMSHLPLISCIFFGSMCILLFEASVM